MQSYPVLSPKQIPVYHIWGCETRKKKELNKFVDEAHDFYTTNVFYINCMLLCILK